MVFPDGQEKKRVKKRKKKTLQGDDGWFSSAYPRWPPTKKADGKGEIVNAQKIFLILWFLQFSICSIWNIYLSNKVITRMSCLWGYWQPTELTFQSYRILPSKSYCTGFEFRVICQGEKNRRSNEKTFWFNLNPLRLAAVCSVFTIVLYFMTISSKTLMMIKIAMPMMMMMITEIEKRPLWNGFVRQDNHIWHIAPQRAHGSYCNWAGLNINGPLSIYPSYLN